MVLYDQLNVLQSSLSGRVRERGYVFIDRFFSNSDIARLTLANQSPKDRQTFVDRCHVANGLDSANHPVRLFMRVPRLQRVDSPNSAAPFIHDHLANLANDLFIDRGRETGNADVVERAALSALELIQMFIVPSLSHAAKYARKNLCCKAQFAAASASREGLSGSRIAILRTTLVHSLTGVSSARYEVTIR